MADRGVTESRKRKRANRPVAGKVPAVDTGGFDFSTVLAVADAIPVMIAFCDEKLRYRFVNRALAEWFERPRSEILGHSVEELLGSAAFEARKPMLTAALAGERQRFSLEFDHPTRGPLAAQSEYIPQIGPDGSVRGLVILVEDVTEQRIAGRALTESETRFRRIADSAPVPMWVTRLDRTRDFVNAAYVELMGVSEEEARRLDWVKRIHPDDQQRMIEETRAGEASGEIFTLEARFEARPSDYRWMRAVTQPRRDADGQLAGYIGVATDITLIKEAELELRRLVDARTAELQTSDARFRAIFDAVMEIIVLLTPDGTVVEVNRTEASWRHPT